MDPDRFFDDALPAMAARQPAAFGALSGRIAVLVPPRKGWTIHLGDVQAPVHPAPDPRAELALRFTEGALVAFTDGTLDVEAAIEAGDVIADGDLTLLESLGYLLQGGQAGHHVRSM